MENSESFPMIEAIGLSKFYRDFAAIRDVDDPHLSPDGKSVVYVLGTIDLANDKQPKNLWLVKWDGSENRALTFGATEQTHPR